MARVSNRRIGVGMSGHQRTQGVTALIRFACPNCGRECAPFIRRDLPKIVESEWEWVGISYRQPYTDYLCECLRCNEPFLLHIYTPQ